MPELSCFRVKYYSNASSINGNTLSRGVEIYESLQSDYSLNDINEVIELYNVNKYVYDGTLCEFIGVGKEDWLKERYKLSQTLIGKYTSTHNDVFNEYDRVDYNYEEDYWEVVANKCLGRISEIRFNDFLNFQESLIQHIFKQDKLVKKYECILREYMLKHFIESMHMIITKYLGTSDFERKSIVLPSTLTLEDKENIVINYLNSANPNLNYTKLLSNIQNSKEFALNARVKQQAVRVSENLEKNLFNTDKGLRTEICVEFKEGIEESVIQFWSINKIGTIIELNWLKSNMDNPTLLNNFIYLFEFVDSRMISNFPYKEALSSIFEKYGFRYDKEYSSNFAFSKREALTLYQMHAYYSYLKNNGRDLESIIEWFFNDYLDEEFGINGFYVKLPPQGNPYFEKCKSIFPTIESIVKKYSLYLEDGHIDDELIQLDSKSMLFSDCPSMTNKRYAYLHIENNEAQIVQNLLFSDQSRLTYFPSIGESKYNSLIEILEQTKLYKEDVQEYQIQSIDWLVNNGFLNILNDGQIVLANRNIMLLYYYIYMEGVIVPHKILPTLRIEAEKLIAEGSLVFENKLLTRQEADYFDYYLNKSKFINGHNLRNDYLHGTSSSYDKENEHYVNYLHAMKLLVTLVIKINDDLCTAANTSLDN